MPITTARFLNVLNAGQKWRRAFENSKVQAQAILEQQSSGGLSPNEAAAMLFSTFIVNTPQPDEVVALAVESYLLNPTRVKFNERERLRQQRRRKAKRGGSNRDSSSNRPQLTVYGAGADDELREPTPAELKLIAQAMKAELTTGAPTEIDEELLAAAQQIAASASAEPKRHSLAEIQPPAITEEDLKDFSL